MLADSHVHLDRYSEREISQMLRRARRVGVRALLTVGTDLASSTQAVGLAQRHSGVYAAVGIHPRSTHQEGLELALGELERLARCREVVAIGEVGLDIGSSSPLERQEAFLQRCLGLARRAGLAVSLHVVGAHELAQTILREEEPSRVVLHYFQGDRRLAASYLELGCSISLGKPVTRDSSGALQDVARFVPLERLLLETDTYPLSGRSTEPRDLVQVASVVAELRSISMAVLEEQLSTNFDRLFRKAIGTNGPRK